MITRASGRPVSQPRPIPATARRFRARVCRQGSSSSRARAAIQPSRIGSTAPKSASGTLLTIHIIGR